MGRRQPWIPIEKWAADQGITAEQAVHLFKNEGFPPYLVVKVTKDGSIKVKPEIIRRAVVLSLKEITDSKRRKINSLIERFRAAANRVISFLWKEGGALDKPTLAKLHDPHLSQRYLSGALKQALEMVSSTKKSAKALGCQNPKMPKFRGYPILDSKYVSIKPTKKASTYKWWLNLSTLASGQKINLPLKGTAVLNRWLEKGHLIQGCELHPTKIIVWVELPTTPYKSEGTTLAFDTNYKHLLVDQLGTFHASDNGKDVDPEWLEILRRLQTRKPGGKGFKRAQAHRANYVNRIINRIDLSNIRFLGIDDLKGIKTGKRNSSRRWRKARAPWSPRQVKTRLIHRCQVDRVYSIAYNPRNTSRECPKCNMVSKANRKGDVFKCVGCGYTSHADFVGALNGFDRTSKVLGSLESPRGENSSGVDLSNE
jgi:transposase